MAQSRMVVIVLILLLAYNPLSGQTTHILEFDETGKLISEPPNSIEGGDRLQFNIYTKPETIKTRRNQLIDKFQSAFDRIKDPQCYIEENGLLDAYKSFVIQDPAIYDFIYNNIINKLTSIKLSLRESLDILKKNKISIAELSRITKSKELPAIEDIISPKFAVNVYFMRENDVVSNTFSLELTQQPDSVWNSTADIRFISDPNTLKSGDGVQKIRYEIYEKNNYYDWIDSRLNDTSLKNTFDDIRIYQEETEKFRNKIIEKSSELMTIKRTDMNCVEFEKKGDFATSLQNLFKENADSPEKLYNLFTNYNKRYYEITDNSIYWLLNFIWLNDGKLLANPFTYNPAKKETKGDSKKIDTLNIELKVLEAKIKLADTLLKPARKGVKTIKNSELENHEDTYEELVQKREEINLQIKELNKTIKDNTDDNTKNKESATKQSDLIKKIKFLHSGLLYCKPTKDKEAIFTRYHDAANSYNLMHRKPTNEILENQSMHIIVENADAESKLKINTEIEDIKFEFSAAEIAILGVDNNFIETSIDRDVLEHNKGILPLATVTATASHIEVENEELFQLYLQSFKLSKIYQNGLFKNDFTPTKETNASFNARELSIATNKSAPFIVRYDIVTGKDSITTSKISPSFSVFRLHRFRFKMGLLYSNLIEQDITIKDNIPSITRNTAGLNVTFGLQTFFCKQDIRNTRFNVGRVYTYVGLKVDTKLTENFYLGIGDEFFNGIGICGGLHLGKTSGLQNVNGNYIKTDNKWVSGGFISVLIDPRVFGRIFNFSNISNPFKK